jgi:hypothetical protein
MMQGSSEAGPGFYANPDGIKDTAKRLDEASKDMHRYSVEMRKAMFGTQTEPGTTSGPVTVFGAMTPWAVNLGQKFNDLIDEVAGYGYVLGDTMSEAAEQLRKTGDIYAKTDSEISGN